MNSVSSLALQVQLETDQSSNEALRAGQTVYGRVIDRSGKTATLDVLGNQVEVTLPESITVGTAVPLRIIDVQPGAVEAQVVLAGDNAESPTQAVTPEPAGSDVVRSVRRLVDVAAEKLFGGSGSRTIASRVLDISPQATLRVAVRGDRPTSPLVTFEPEDLQASAALAAATSEEILAAQAALERLAVPATPLTIAAALPDANDPARLVAVLAKMSAMLAELTPEGRLTTLKTLAEFLSRIAPDEMALDAQISSFVDQIASGGERKLLDLLSALAQRSQNGAAQRLLLTARATERATSLTNDIKTQLFVASNAEEADSPLASILNEALEVVTAAQLTSLNAAQKSPGAVAFVLPIASGRATFAAQVTVQRDSPEGRHRRLDANNFRISFALDTRHLGTVYIDVESVSRALRVTIETQTTQTTDRIRAVLDTLREGLLARGYRSVVMTVQMVRRLAYREDVQTDEQRTYLPTMRSPLGDPSMPKHLDTRA